MMKANELRIGSIVTVDNPRYHSKLKDIPLIVTGIQERVIQGETEHCVNLEHINQKHNTHYDTYSQYIKFISLIPLTEEILLKCGFEQVDDMCYHPDMKIRSLYINTFILRKNTCSNLFEFHFQHKNLHMFENVEVKSLHQLQNLFFALTGAELEINL